jgi:radical SAM superfamily enzyme YgiQ (UPF0313 family)
VDAGAKATLDVLPDLRKLLKPRIFLSTPAINAPSRLNFKNIRKWIRAIPVNRYGTAPFFEIESL